MNNSTTGSSSLFKDLDIELLEKQLRVIQSEYVAPGQTMLVNPFIFSDFIMSGLPDLQNVDSDGVDELRYYKTGFEFTFKHKPINCRCVWIPVVDQCDIREAKETTIPWTVLVVCLMIMTLVLTLITF